MDKQSTIETVLSRPNRLILAALLLLTAFAWLQLFGGQSAGVLMHHTHYIRLGFSPAWTGVHTWKLRDLASVFLMWLLMAVAMMLPTAAPAILSFAEIARAGHHMERASARIAAFVLGYLLVWWGFGLLATTAHWRLAAAGLYFSDLKAGRPLLGGTILIAAGLYQFSSLKEICLAKCRSPIAFFLAHWRDGMRGATYLGLHHGIDCLGCCWALMSLMLFAGTMSVVWTAGLSALMLAEKVVPAGHRLARVIGIALIVCGVALIVPAFLRGELT